MSPITVFHLKMNTKRSRRFTAIDRSTDFLSSSTFLKLSLDEMCLIKSAHAPTKGIARNTFAGQKKRANAIRDMILRLDDTFIQEDYSTEVKGKKKIPIV